MKSKKNEAGDMVFSREEWLTVQQVKSYFARLSSLKRNGALNRIDPNVDLDTFNMVTETMERQQLKECKNEKCSCNNLIRTLQSTSLILTV
jgi:plasmid rolling circle replication initiator protein Rep